MNISSLCLNIHIQSDSYSVTGTGIMIDFDNQKSGTYSLLVDNFQDTLTGTVFLSGLTSIPEPQKFSYDWNKVVNSASDSVQYELDTDNNGNYDISSNFSAIPKSVNEKGSISGYVKGDTNASMAGWKVCIDKNGDGKLQENSEPFAVTDNKGYYRFENLDRGSYVLLEIPHQNWNTSKGKYVIVLNNGQNVLDFDFI